MDPALRILKGMKSFPPEEDVLEVPDEYDTDRWTAAFVGPGAIQHHNEDVADLLRNYPSRLTRNQILGIKGADPATQNRRILIASLMWGYGTTGLHRNPDLTNVGTLLRSQGLDERLSVCRDRLSQGDVAEAYMGLTDIRGIRSAFFTKFLYFLGRSLDPGSEYPLILDSKVAESLAWLTGYRKLVKLNDYWPANDEASAGTYATYVSTMHEWARTLDTTGDTTADEIEYYLYRHSKDELFHAACMKMHSPLTSGIGQRPGRV